MYFKPPYSMPGIYKTSAEGGGKFRIINKNGKITVETIPDPNSPGTCDKSRALIEQICKLGDQVESARAVHPIEEKMMTPVEAEPEIEREVEKY